MHGKGKDKYRRFFCFNHKKYFILFLQIALFLDYLILLTFFGTFRPFESDTTVSLYNISCFWKAT